MVAGRGAVPYQVPAVANAVAILQLLQADGQRRAPADIARALNLSRSSCHNLFQALREFGFVVYDEATRQYDLGPAPIRPGMAAARPARYVDVAIRHWRPLVEEVRLVGLVMRLLPDGHVVIVDKVESPNPLPASMGAGETFPVTAGASGQVFLAWLSEDEIDAYLDRFKLPPYSPRAITDAARYEQELAQVRRQGYSTNVGESYVESHAVAAPVFDSRGKVALAVAITAFSELLAAEELPTLGQRLGQVAQAITQEVRGRRPAPRMAP